MIEEGKYQMIEQGKARDFGLISTAIIILSIGFLVSLAPVVGAISALLGLVAVIMLLVELGKMSTSEKTPFYVSIVVYLLAIAVSIVGVFANLGVFLAKAQTGQTLTAADLQLFIDGVLPYFVVGTVMIQIAYLFLPFGFALKRERLMLIAAFAVSVILSVSSLYLFYIGYFHLTGVPSATTGLSGVTGLSNSLVARALSVPGVVLWFVSYLLIGLRMSKGRNSKKMEM